MGLGGASKPVAKRFYVGGNNGAILLSGLMAKRGWVQIIKGDTGKRDTRFFLKWCERASDISFTAFKEGKQMVVGDNSALPPPTRPPLSLSLSLSLFLSLSLSLTGQNMHEDTDADEAPHQCPIDVVACCSFFLFLLACAL